MTHNKRLVGVVLFIVITLHLLTFYFLSILTVAPSNAMASNKPKRQPITIKFLTAEAVNTMSDSHQNVTSVSQSTEKSITYPSSPLRENPHSDMKNQLIFGSVTSHIDDGNVIDEDHDIVHDVTDSSLPTDTNLWQQPTDNTENVIDAQEVMAIQKVVEERKVIEEHLLNNHHIYKIDSPFAHRLTKQANKELSNKEKDNKEASVHNNVQPKNYRLLNSTNPTDESNLDTSVLVETSGLALESQDSVSESNNNSPQPFIADTTDAQAVVEHTATVNNTATDIIDKDIDVDINIDNNQIITAPPTLDVNQTHNKRVDTTDKPAVSSSLFTTELAKNKQIQSIDARSFLQSKKNQRMVVGKVINDEQARQHLREPFSTGVSDATRETLTPALLEQLQIFITNKDSHHTVKISFFIDKTGQVIQEPAPEIEKSSGNVYIDNDALYKILHAQFRPFTDNGREIQVFAEMTIIYYSL